MGNFYYKYRHKETGGFDGNYTVENTINKS